MGEKSEKLEKVPVKSEEQRGGFLEGAYEPLAHFRDEMDRLFDDFMSGWPFGPARRRGRALMAPFRGMVEPFGTVFGRGVGMAAVDVIDKDKEIQVRAELPGMDENDIDVRVSEGTLTIHGEKKEEREEGEEGGNYYLSERRYGSFQRSFRLPEGIDLDHVDATFKKGVLTVTLPKTKESMEKTKKVKVKGES